jgi:hypothetical protein
MNEREARQKFGQFYEDEDGNQRWEMDHNKLRGMFLKYSRDVDYLEGPEDWPDAEHWMANFWTFVKDRIGTGYRGILQCPEPSPSGRFDRIGQSEAARVANAYYDSHEEFRDNMDEVWHYNDCTVDIPEGGNGYMETMEGADTKEVIQAFFNIYEGHGNLMAVRRQSCSVRAYKYHIKQWVFECDSIKTHDAKPNAEALVEQWIEWLGSNVLRLERPVVTPGDGDNATSEPIPNQEEITEWCRELWQDSDKFREHVKEKWNKSTAGEDGAGPDPDEMVSLRKGIDVGGSQKQGQTGIGDY